MQLPAPLTPWAPWLTLLPLELADMLGQMLLRLDPFVGRLTPAALDSGDQPAGIGNIVRRGHYERLLMTEWAYADAAPDEFLRRAGSGELLFTGPEPAVRQRALDSIALFDAGPLQLGEPRLAQVSLLILLARRAGQAGARFRWGIWQQPGTLHDSCDAAALRSWTKARSLITPAQAGQRWQDALPPEVEDCWLIGAAMADPPAQVSASIAIRPSLLAPQLKLTLQQRRAVRTLTLDLPDASDGVALLRQLVARPSQPHAPPPGGARAARSQPPLFGMQGQRLAVAQLGGGVISYNVPAAAHSKPGKPRIEPAGKGAILAAGLFNPKLSCVRAFDQELVFQNFPGPLFARQRRSAPRPPREVFLAPPGTARWLPAFFQQTHAQERVVLLDKQQHLVYWQANKDQPSLSFGQAAVNVIGITGLRRALMFGCREDNGIQLYHWSSEAAQPSKYTFIGHTGQQLLFGTSGQRAGYHNLLLAIQRSDSDWWISHGGDGAAVEIDDGAIVLGVSPSVRDSDAGLVVLHPGRRRFELRHRRKRRELFSVDEPVQHASFDAVSRRVAWVSARSSSVYVRGLDDDHALLAIGSEGDQDAG